MDDKAPKMAQLAAPIVLADVVGLATVLVTGATAAAGLVASLHGLLQWMDSRAAARGR